MISNVKYEAYNVIRINRTMPGPSVLSTSRDRTRYRSDDVVQALLLMQHQKCCYCEMFISDSGSGKQVEHFRPKSVFKELEYDWNNLLLACADCNGAKSDMFPISWNGEPLLVDPADPALDPEDHIEFVVKEQTTAQPSNSVAIELPLGLAVARNSSPLGQETIRVLQLWRPHHIKRRRGILDTLRLSYTSLLTERKRISLGNGDAKQMNKAKGMLQEAIGSDKAYAGLARAFARGHGLERLGIHLNL